MVLNGPFLGLSLQRILEIVVWCSWMLVAVCILVPKILDRFWGALKESTMCTIQNALWGWMQGGGELSKLVEKNVLPRLSNPRFVPDHVQLLYFMTGQKRLLSPCQVHHIQETLFVLSPYSDPIKGSYFGNVSAIKVLNHNNDLSRADPFILLWIIVYSAVDKRVPISRPYPGHFPLPTSPLPPLPPSIPLSRVQGAHNPTYGCSFALRPSFPLIHPHPPLLQQGHHWIFMLPMIKAQPCPKFFTFC